MYRMLKPGIDFLVSLVLFVVFLPIIVLVGIVLALDLRGWPLFLQQRPGYLGKPFKLVKFKTMLDTVDAEGHLLPDELRLTRVGKWVRKLSLDELPQFINVLKGEMSLVGPRPLLMEYLPLYNECQMRRHEVRPGITGWAQVNGRNAVNWPERFELDVWYVEHLSFGLDVRILWMTVMKVIKREGISGDGSATMVPFRGGKRKSKKVKK